MTKQLEQIFVVIALLALGFFLFTKPSGLTSIGQGGADINGLPWFLSYNMPTLISGQNSPLPPLSSGQQNVAQTCDSCSIFGNPQGMFL